MRHRSHTKIVYRNIMLISLSQTFLPMFLKVQVGKDQEKAQSERDSHSKNLELF